MVSHAIVLGDFLRARRSAIDVAAVGLPSYGQRRVPGLRREEVALMAGISTSYYTRIEQGAVTAASPSVLDGIARALQLDPDERAHLYRLARAVTPPPGATQTTLNPLLESLLACLDWLPAGVLGSDMGLRGWNAPCHQVFADHLPFDTPRVDPAANWARLLFLDPYVQRRFDDWEAVALDLAGRLRASQARNPSDPALAAVIDDLRRESDDFVRLWELHPAREAPLGGVVIHHPTLGDLRLTDATLRPTGAEEELLIIFLPDPGSGTERKLRTQRTAVFTNPAVDPTGAP